MSKIITSVCEFKIVHDLTAEEFINKVNFLEEHFHSQQNGFIDTELAEGIEDRQWVIIQHWQSMDKIKAAIKMMMQNPITEDYRKSIDPTSVKMLLLVQNKTWRKLP